MSNLFYIKETEDNKIAAIEKHSNRIRFIFDKKTKRDYILKVIKDSLNKGFCGKTPSFIHNKMTIYNNDAFIINNRRGK